MRIVCPYCDMEITERSIDAEDGCCPECGALVMASNLFPGEEEEGYKDEYDDLDDDDQLLNSFDLDDVEEDD